MHFVRENLDENIHKITLSEEITTLNDLIGYNWENIVSVQLHTGHRPSMAIGILI